MLFNICSDKNFQCDCCSNQSDIQVYTNGKIHHWCNSCAMQLETELHKHFLWIREEIQEANAE